MIKNKNIKKEKNNKPLKEIKQTSKDNFEKLSPGKPEIKCLKSSKTLNVMRKPYNKNMKIHNTISSKEEVDMKKSPNKLRNKNIKQNLMNNNCNNNNGNRLFSSNILFLTKDTDNLSNEKGKKLKKNFKKNFSNSDKVYMNQLNHGLKKNYLKQTIIIDNEGNNNLNLNLNNMDRKDYKNILNLNNNNKFEFNNSISFSGNTETNSLFENSNNFPKNIYNTINKESDIKQTIIDKNDEERRLKEYNRIFNLLNSNIEQFKKMFNNSNTNNIINNNHINENKNRNKNKKIIIKTKTKKSVKSSKASQSITSSKKKIISINNEKEKNDQSNIKKNLSEKNLRRPIKSRKSFNNNLLSIDLGDINFETFNKNNEIKIHQNYNDDLKNNNFSFLESSIDNDFYQSLINQTFLQNISHPTFEINIDEINNDDYKKKNKLNQANILNENNKRNFQTDTNSNKENEIYRENNNGNNNLRLENKNEDKLKKNKSECNNHINIIEKSNCFIF